MRWTTGRRCRFKDLDQLVEPYKLNSPFAPYRCTLGREQAKYGYQQLLYNELDKLMVELKRKIDSNTSRVEVVSAPVISQEDQVRIIIYHQRYITIRCWSCRAAESAADEA